MEVKAMGKRTRKGFTLVELLLVMLIISVLIGMLVPVIPPLVSQVKSNQSLTFINTLAAGVEQYRRVYGRFPTNGYFDPKYGYPAGTGWEAPGCGYSQNSTPRSLWVALQGPTGRGWTKEEMGVTLEFGPFPDAAGNNVRQEPFGYQTASKPIFVDAFGSAVLYYRADESKPENFDNQYEGNRYKRNCNRNYWYQQKGNDGVAMGDGGYGYQFQKRMTRVQRQNGQQLPQCPDTYVLWTAGKDGKFGYWRWDDSYNGPVVDAQGGVCDDMTTLPE